MRGKRRGLTSAGGRRGGSIPAWVFLVCTSILLCSAALPLGGCRGREEAATEEEAVEEKPVEDGEEVKPETTAEEASELLESGGATEFKLQNQSIGSGSFITGIQLTDIYWQDHGDFLRIAFEYHTDDGGEPTSVPNLSTFYGGTPGNEEYWKIYIVLSDIILEDMKAPTFAAEGVPISLGNPIVQTMERTPTADTESVVFLVKCTYSPAHPGVSSRPHRLRYQTHPMRIMVDIMKY